jgi:hypothetical protein
MLAVAALGICACGAPAPGSESSDAQARDLDVEARLALDLHEVSGIAALPGAADEALTIVAVGDASRRIAAVVADVEPYQADDLFEGDAEASQWESVATDGAGRVFVLDESTDRIEVFDGAGVRKQVISLDLGDIADDWTREPNAKGEGLVLLANGHMLVVKEREPTLFVEFGPPGDDAEGYRPELALPAKKAFPLSTSRTPKLAVLHHWELHASVAERATDISDLCVGPGGRLFALSDEGRVFAQLERELSAEENKVEARQWYKLPNKVRKPEGLLFVDRTPVVADDNDNDDPDIYWLTEVAAP